MQNASTCRPPRLAIATLPTLDHFVAGLASSLPISGVLDVATFMVRAPGDLDAILAWTDQPGDAVWFEFCWPPVPNLISQTSFGHRRVMVRVHRIEAYETDFVARTDWTRVHDLIVVSSDMARVVREVVPGIDDQVRVHVVHNGVDLSLVAPRAGFDPHCIGWCGTFNLRKNPSLALQVLYELHLYDADYVLRIASGAADRITMESFRHQAQALGVSDAIRFDGRVSAGDMPAWHARNGFLLSTSLHESFGYAIAEAAAAGCDAGVLDHPGAAEFWPQEMRFTTVNDAANMIRQGKPDRWTALIAERFSLDRQVAALRALLATGGHAGHSPQTKAWSASYWETRYRRGGDSGSGSAGRLAQFKADTVNRIVAEAGVASVIEFGCGDGRQLELSRYPAYVGVDVSQEAVRQCSQRFHGDTAKRFCCSDEDPGEADLVLSMDVIFHLVEDEVFARYMHDLFVRAHRFVVIYASNYDAWTPDSHVRHREFCRWVERNAPDWRRVDLIANPYPHDPSAPAETSFSDFHVFGRVAAMETV